MSSNHELSRSAAAVFLGMLKESNDDLCVFVEAPAERSARDNGACVTGRNTIDTSAEPGSRSRRRRE
jgi:hypothetical protein